MTTFTFQPKTEEEIAEGGLWEAGQYPFEILDEVTFGSKTFYTENTTSRASDSPMIQLIIKVYNDEGKFRTIIDRLVASLEYKVRHAAAACGLLEKYYTGVLHSDDFKGKQGYLILKVEPASVDKNTGKEYRAKNTVKDYVAPENDGSVNYTPPPGHPASASLEDDIQF